MVVAAEDMRDLHIDVVDHHGKVVERRAIRAEDHEVANILTLEADSRMDRVLPRQLSGGKAQPDRVLLHVGFALLQQLVGDLLMAREPGALEDGRLIPIKPEPREPVEDDLRVFVGGARFVRVLDTQQKLAALAAGEEPVEERRSGAADVEVASGGGSEADADVHRRIIESSCCLRKSFMKAVAWFPQPFPRGSDAASPVPAAR